MRYTQYIRTSHRHKLAELYVLAVICWQLYLIFGFVIFSLCMYNLVCLWDLDDGSCYCQKYGTSIMISNAKISPTYFPVPCWEKKRSFDFLNEYIKNINQLIFLSKETLLDWSINIACLNKLCWSLYKMYICNWPQIKVMGSNLNLKPLKINRLKIVLTDITH